MSDPGVFAVLIPCDQKSLARDAFALKANANFYQRASHAIAEEPTITSRESTPALDLPHEGSYDLFDHILLTFKHKPKDPREGWQFRTNPLSSNVLLGHRGSRGISGRHFRVVITEQFSIELYDTSRLGTAVSYDNLGKDKVRKNEKWLLSYEPGKQRRWREVIVYVPDKTGLAFKIEFPNHQSTHPEYLANLHAFCEESKVELPSFNVLGLDSAPTTTAPSRSQTPRQRPIYLDDGLIGRGSFGEVRRVIRADDGQLFAAKKFDTRRLNTANRKRKRDQNELEDPRMTIIRNEVAIMKVNPHPNIMRVIEFRETPKPLLLMPYYPLGSLTDYDNATQEQHVSAFRQVLLGIRHLHQRGVVHRDIK
ncbi:MAG: hypothetical protein Q9160_009170 [Pyrenula sp. 1 TL-2023]